MQTARKRLDGHGADLEVADFFRVRWEEVLQRLPEPTLIIGNPPWVTNSALGAMEADNLPTKSNLKGHSGIDARTGKSNFDISEWMLTRLIEAAGPRRFLLAMLCKTSVARKVMERAATLAWRPEGSTRSIDAQAHFSAAVHAALLMVQSQPKRADSGGDLRWGVYPSLSARHPTRYMGVVDGRTCSDVDAFLATRGLDGESEIEWRSGLKHDCASVMELVVGDDGLVNGLGEAVDIEAEYVYPLVKGSDLAHGRVSTRRRVIVTQRRLGEETAVLRERAPAAWKYLDAHRRHFEARKSSIYRDQPEFSMFGIGDYSFAPYKVAIGGLYKKLAFSVVGPMDGRPVMVDDTSYFLPCTTLEEASELAGALNGGTAREFFEARVFWDSKRPVNKALLQSLSLAGLFQSQNRTPPRSLVQGRQLVLPF